MTKIGNSGYRHFFIIEVLIYLDLDMVMATMNDKGLSIYYIVRDGGIHAKSGRLWRYISANFFGFSAKF